MSWAVYRRLKQSVWWGTQNVTISLSLRKIDLFGQRENTYYVLMRAFLGGQKFHFHDTVKQLVKNFILSIAYRHRSLIWNWIYKVRYLVKMNHNRCSNYDETLFEVCTSVYHKVLCSSVFRICLISPCNLPFGSPMQLRMYLKHST